MPSSFKMSDVMISYAREDQPFVKKLDETLRAENLEAWVDWQDIAPTADWWSEIQAGIESAHTFVFVITPASARSDTCRREVEHAVKHSKRLIPILHKELSAGEKALLHPALAAHNWIYFRESDHFRRAYLMLRVGLETDLAYKQMHTRLVVRSRDWQEQKRSSSLVLRGDDLREAEKWLAQSFNQTPHVTERQIEYIRASRRAAGRFTQRLIGAAIVVLVLLSGGMVLAVFQSVQASDETQRALNAANLRATQEQVANSNLIMASTAQQLALDSGIAASTAQAKVIEAQTQQSEALLNSGNSQTRAYVAQQSALTATVLQGEAQNLAAAAQQQQQAAEVAQQQAQAQASVAQQGAAAAVSTQDAAQLQVGITATAAAINVANVEATSFVIQTNAANSVATSEAIVNEVQQTVAAAQTGAAGAIQTIQPTLDEANNTLTAAVAARGTAEANGTLSADELAYKKQEATNEANRLGTARAEKNGAFRETQTIAAMYSAATATANYINHVDCTIHASC